MEGQMESVLGADKTDASKDTMEYIDWKTSNADRWAAKRHRDQRLSESQLKLFETEFVVKPNRTIILVVKRHLEGVIAREQRPKESKEHDKGTKSLNDKTGKVDMMNKNLEKENKWREIG